MLNKNTITSHNYMFERIKPTEQIDIEYFGWQKAGDWTIIHNSIKQDYTIHIVLKGQGVFSYNNNTYKLKENDFFLINPVQSITYYPNKDNPWEYFWIGLSGDGVQHFLNSLSLLDSQVGVLISISKIKNLIGFLKNNREQNVLSIYRTQSILMQILDEMLAQKDNTSNFIFTRNELIQNAQRYIKDNYSKRIKITAMCKHLLVERTTLFKTFKKILGMSPQQYVLNFKLQTAKGLICETKKSFSEIAISCGFSNYSYFSRAFTKLYGYNPSEVRKSTVFGGISKFFLLNASVSDKLEG